MAGKVIVITGAGGGLGRALARDCADHGDDVVLLGRTAAKLEALAREIGARALAVVCDVASPESVRAAFAAIAQRHGRIDVLINNAAIFRPFLLDEATDQVVADTVLTNFLGPILCARQAIPLLGQGGHIINVSSESVEVALPHLVVYQATKAGLEQFGKDLDLELSGRGFRVSTVRPGQLYGEEMSGEIESENAARFYQEALARGFDLRARGSSRYASTCYLFRTIIDAPADIRIGTIAFQGRSFE